MSLACRTIYRADDVTVSEAAKVSATTSVPRQTLVTDDPLLPVRRHKSRHAAVPAAGTGDTIAPTVMKPTSDVAAGCVEQGRRRFTGRQACSDGEYECYRAVRGITTTTAVSSLPACRSASVGHLPHQAATVTSLHWSDDVTVTSSAAAAAAAAAVTGSADVTSRGETDETMTCKTTSLYAEPRGRRHETQQTSIGSSALQRNTAESGVNERHADDTHSSSDNNYESVEYNHSQFMSTPYSQQSNNKHHVRHSLLSCLYITINFNYFANQKRLQIICK